MVDFLFHEISRKHEGERIRPHRHDFWQLDLIRDGRLTITVGRRDYACATGDLLLIPPGQPHGHVCQTPRSRSVIVKFRAEDAPGRSVRQLHASAALEHAAGLLASLLETAPAKLAGATREQVNLTLQVVLIEAYRRAWSRRDEESRPPLAGQVEQYVNERRGGYVTVSEVADRIGYSASHVSRLFREERGESLKEFLDRKRAEASKAALLYSEQTISEIAAQQEFPDLAAFSRFVRRHLGCAPRELRRRAD